LISSAASNGIVLANSETGATGVERLPQ